MLVGRDTERRVLRRVVNEAHAGRGGAVALIGEPGIGKSALLEDLASGITGLSVLRARGVVTEARVPFAGLLQLLRPVLDVIGELPPRQAAVMEGALALGPATSRDRFAVGAATLGLLSACAERHTVVLVLDDAHWLDASTMEAVLFAVRRVERDRIAAIVTARPGSAPALEAAGLPTLTLAGIDAVAARELVRGDGQPSLDDDAFARLYAATAGNPLALLELAGEGAPALGGGPAGAP
ncbi:MAG: ATP-binding protein, partial [Thermoleophilia bacterium]